MSLIGIDVGSSAIKVVAYDESGTALAGARREVPAYRPEPGHWEVDVEESSAAFWSALGEVAIHPDVLRDPPIAVSFSSSGREVFPVAADGTPLGRCLMTADTRGDDVAAEVASRRSPEAWFSLTGHVPRRMDPVCRALWWQRDRPDVSARTRWFMNWHEYYALELSGLPVVDWSDAGAWATYDVATAAWSPARIEETGIDPAWLPQIRPNGAAIGTILPEAAARSGLPAETLIVTGAYDTYAAAVGSGAILPGQISLACGSWNSFNTPVSVGWPVDLVHDGLNVFPHPGPTGFGILVTDPNGMSVVDRARELLGLSISELEAGLGAASPGPGHVFADPAFTPLPHVAADEAVGGELSGLTLATTAVDIVRALLEGIACRFSLALDLLDGHGIEASLVRATGGGARNTWWMQLLADMSGTPVEVCTEEEPGALGAAILAGVGAGVYPSVSGAAALVVTTSRRFEPDTGRGLHYAGLRERLAGT